MTLSTFLGGLWTSLHFMLVMIVRGLAGVFNFLALIL
jgi:hypothetical protein